MSTTPSRPALHPMLWVAAASVTALSLAGVAKLTGLLPESGTAAPQTSAVTGAVAPEPVAPTRLATAEPPRPAPNPPQPPPWRRATRRRPMPYPPRGMRRHLTTPPAALPTLRPQRPSAVTAA